MGIIESTPERLRRSPLQRWLAKVPGSLFAHGEDRARLAIFAGYGASLGNQSTRQPIPGQRADYEPGTPFWPVPKGEPGTKFRPQRPSNQVPEAAMRPRNPSTRLGIVAGEGLPKDGIDGNDGRVVTPEAFWV